MDDLTIEQLSLVHLDALREIGRATFLETFGERNSAENMRQYLEQGFAREKLKQNWKMKIPFFTRWKRKAS